MVIIIVFYLERCGDNSNNRSFLFRYRDNLEKVRYKEF